MRVSVVYVAFRTPLQMLQESIATVEVAARRADIELEIIVVDNGGAAEQATALAPARVLGNGQNVGFGDAVNLGVAEATGEWVLMMNPDSTADVDLFVHLESTRKEFGERVFLGALLLNAGVPQMHAYNVWWTSVHLLLAKRRWSRRLTQVISAARPREVTRLCGAGLYASREQLLALGPFDSTFFLYGEDVDLSLRAQKRGLTTVLVPRAVVHHDAGTSSEGASRLVEQARTDAHLRVVSRHRSYAVSLLARADALVSAVVGAALSRNPTTRTTRLARLREIRRWGLHRTVPRFSPNGRA